LAEPGFTFEDYLTRVAQRVALASYAADPNNQASIPTDANRRARLEQAVRDGVSYFARGQTTEIGTPTRWTWLEAEQSLTLDATGAGPRNIDEDAAHYLLDPEVQSAPKGLMRWRVPTDGGGSGTVYVTDIDTVRRRLDRNPDETGCPEMASLERVARLSSSQATRYSLVVAPRPDQTYTLRWRSRVSPMPFTNLTERGIWPAMHDLTVVECAVCAFHQISKQPGDPVRAAAESARREAMLTSVGLDREARPRRIGQLGWSPQISVAPEVPATPFINDLTGEPL